jgi:hypothetical protein
MTHYSTILSFGHNAESLEEATRQRNVALRALEEAGVDVRTADTRPQQGTSGSTSARVAVGPYA